MEIPFLHEFPDREHLRKWLQENHSTSTECWVSSYVKNRREGALAYSDIVEEALCFGWIDSTKKKTPDGKLAQRISPRRPRSHWTERNRELCRDLQRRGLLTEDGLRALGSGEECSA